MEDSKDMLVVYYSRTGTTRRVAEALAAELDAELEEVIDTTPRAGAFGYIKAGKDALFKKPTGIEEREKDPAEFGLVLVGTPVWASAVTPAIRTYLQQNGSGIEQPIFFLTTGGTGIDSTFRQMEELCGRKPLATFSLLAREVKKDEYAAKVQAFAEHVRHEVLGQPPGEPA